MDKHLSKHSNPNYQPVPTLSSGPFNGENALLQHTKSSSIEGLSSMSHYTPVHDTSNHHSGQYSSIEQYPNEPTYTHQRQYLNNSNNNGSGNGNNVIIDNLDITPPQGRNQYRPEEDGDPTTLPVLVDEEAPRDISNSSSHLNNRYPCVDDFNDPSLSSSSSLYLTPPGKALTLQLLTTLSTIIFTVLPVVVKSGKATQWGQFYSWKDACRLIEPFVSGLFHTWFFYNSDLMRTTRGYHQSMSLSWQQQHCVSNKQHDIPMTTRRRFSANSAAVAAENHHARANANNNGNGNGNSNSNIGSFAQSQLEPGIAANSNSNNKRSFKNSSKFKTTLSLIFTFFLILYATGGAIHTAAALFKNVVAFFLQEHSRGIGLSTHPLTQGDGQLSMELAQKLKDGYLLMQDVWEHKASHYMYAIGALGMSWCEMIAYSEQVLPRGVNLARVGHLTKRNQGPNVSVKSSKRLVFLWILAGVLYGGIVAGVACQYPKGLYVGIVYVILLLLVVCGYILTRPTRGLFSLGRHYILQTYVIGGVVAAVVIIIYMAVNDFDMLTSNDRSYLGSITRP